MQTDALATIAQLNKTLDETRSQNTALLQRVHEMSSLLDAIEATAERRRTRKLAKKERKSVAVQTEPAESLNSNNNNNNNNEDVIELNTSTQINISNSLPHNSAPSNTTLSHHPYYYPPLLPLPAITPTAFYPHAVTVENLNHSHTQAGSLQQQEFKQQHVHDKMHQQQQQQHEQLSHIAKPVNQASSVIPLTIPKEQPIPNSNISSNRNSATSTPTIVREVTSFKAAASLMLISADTGNKPKLLCSSGTIALKCINQVYRTGRIVMYDDESDEKLFNIRVTETEILNISCDQHHARICCDAIHWEEIDSMHESKKRKYENGGKGAQDIRVYVLQFKSSAIASDLVGQVRSLLKSK